MNFEVILIVFFRRKQNILKKKDEITGKHPNKETKMLKNPIEPDGRICQE